MQQPPLNAVILFNGKDLNNWIKRGDSSPAEWTVDDGVMTVKPGTGDIMTTQKFTDFVLHVEFMTPLMPEARGQGRGNSGVYLQGRYEVQVLDSYGIDVPGHGDCGGVYGQFAPLVNACKPPQEWQTYDICFRAARVDESGNVLEHARLTALQNGQVIHNNVQLLGATGGAVDEDVSAPGPLLLQDHGNLMKFRNIWVVELPLKGADHYEGKREEG